MRRHEYSMSKRENKQDRVQLGTDKRSALGQRQRSILITLYRYRFGTRQLLAKSLGVAAGSSLHTRLTALCNHGLVARRYTSHMKLQGKPAAYYLTARGLRVLPQIDNGPRVTAQLIKASYRDAQVSQSFVDHVLAVYQWTPAAAVPSSTAGVFASGDGALPLLSSKATRCLWVTQNSLRDASLFSRYLCC